MRFLFFQPESKNEKSPLQLLAQTCSQIGVDNGPSKMLSNTTGSEKHKTETDKPKKIDIVSSEPDKVSFKPYRHSESSERVSPKSSSSSELEPVLGLSWAVLF